MSGPWPPEMACDFVQMHIEDGDFNGAFVVGSEEEVGVVPCFETPRTTCALLALQVLAGKLPSPDWVIFLSDTYHIELENEADHPGSLEAAFKAGDPRVTEAAVVLCVCPDGPSYQVIQPYVRDGDEIEWGEVDRGKDVIQAGGVMHDLIVALLQTPYGIAPEAACGVEQIRMPL